VVCVLVLAAGMVIEIYLLPHYVAPFTAAFYAIGLQMHAPPAAVEAGEEARGLALARFTVAICVAMAGIRAFAGPLHIAPANGRQATGTSTGSGRDILERSGRRFWRAWLELQPGTTGDRPLLGESRSARRVGLQRCGHRSLQSHLGADAGPAENQELIPYYRDRNVWLVEPDAMPARISPYPIPAIAGK
jgi:hypothetical protein